MRRFALTSALLALAACAGKAPSADTNAPAVEAPAADAPVDAPAADAPVDAPTADADAPAADADAPADEAVASAIDAPADPPVDAPSADTALRGVTWRLTRLGGAPVATEHSFTLSATEPGAMEGNGGCNRIFSNSVAIDGASLRFGGVGATRRACPELGAEQAFVHMLGQVDAWRIEGGALILSGGGRDLASFARG